MTLCSDEEEKENIESVKNEVIFSTREQQKDNNTKEEVKGKEELWVELKEREKITW